MTEVETVTEVIKYTKNLKLLYVEDNQEARESTLIILSEFFDDITVAVDGEDGYNKYKQNNIDLIITDINMPVLNGLDMVQRIKKDNKEISVLVLSAYNESEYFMQSIKHGIDGYLLKPIDMTQFLSVLGKIVQKVKLQQDSKNHLSLLQQYQEAADHSSIISKTDLKGKITYVNEEFCKISEYEKEELLGKAHSIIRHPDNPRKLFENMWKTIENKKVWKGTIKNMSKSGKTYYVKTTIKPILDVNGEILEYIALRDDITDIMNPKKQLEDLIYSVEESVLVLIELIDYKNLEKFYGHKQINHIEEIFSKRLFDYVPENFLFKKVFVLGNGKFALADIMQESNVDKIINDVKIFLNNINKSKFNINKKIYDISVRISFSSGKNVLENCTCGLEKLKTINSDFCVADGLAEVEKQKAQENINTLEMVHTAIENYNIVSYYQPIVDNKTKQVVKYESLVRLIDKDEKVLSPYYFLDTAKRGRFYSQITQIVLKNSFKALTQIDKDISINLSALDIEKEYISKLIFKLLEEYKEHTNRVVFELLEDETIKDIGLVKDFITKAKEYGVKIAIDDFGAGYSNFERLLEYQPDILKIDGSLIKNILTNDYSLSVVKTIISFAKSQNIQTVAEFVENEEIYNKLSELGATYSQGYHFGAPISIERIKN